MSPILGLGHTGNTPVNYDFGRFLAWSEAAFELLKASGD
jgi:hypothetical protein